MTSSSGSIKLSLQWVDRGMVYYLQWVRPDHMYNMQLAKVYHQGGEILYSIKHVPPEISLATLEQEIAIAKGRLATKIAQQVARRLDNALEGET